MNRSKIPQKNQFIRPVSPTEKLYLASAAISPPFCIQMLIEGSGTISVQELEEAVERAGEFNPGSRLFLKKKHQYYYWEDSGVRPPVKIKSLLLDSEKFSTNSLYADNIDPTQDPTCEVLVLEDSSKHESNKSNFKILFRAFHGVMDAHGLLLWVYDIFDMLNLRLPKGNYYKKTDLDVIKSLNANNFRPNLLLNCKTINSNIQNIHNNKFIRRRVSIANHIPGLVAHLAVLIGQECRKDIPGLIRFMIPVNLRSYLPENESGTGNISNPIFIELDDKTNWAEVYQDIIQRLEQQQESWIGKFDHLLELMPIKLINWTLKKTISHQKRSHQFLVSGVLSNIGKIALSDFNTKIFKADSVCFLPFDIPLSPLTIIITEHDNGTELSFSIPDYLMRSSEVDELIERIKINLNFLNLKSISENSSSKKYSHQQLLISFNNTKTEFLNSQSIFDLIHSQALKNPTASALIHLAENLSYFELILQINCCADALLQKKILSEDRIGLILNSSSNAIVCLLAILKIGAVYVPISPSYPFNYIQSILEDVSVSLVILEKEFQNKEDIKDSWVVIDELMNNVNKTDDLLPVNKVSPDSLAYIIYTSGSTGKPKGVQIEHRQLLNYCIWAAEYYFRNNLCNFPLFSSLAFDLTITSIFVPLLTGGCIHIHNNSDSLQIFNTIFQQDVIDSIKLTPSHLRVMLESDYLPTKLKNIIVGGEELSVELCNQTLKRFGKHIILYNEYGPTEATVGCMAHKFDPATDNSIAVPLGKPIDNTQIYVLDDNLLPVNTDSIGEIYISGMGVSRGYLNRAELNQTHFIDNPYLPNQRMYRSGDLARWTNDSHLLYCGRRDEQVKVNGFRIELSQIHSSIMQHPNIKQAVVVVQDNSLGYKSLCAFYVASNQINHQSLRSQLLRDLPNYMIPTQFVHVEQIDLTDNGKVNRKALMAKMPYDNNVIINGDLENELWKIWSFLLSCDLEEHTKYASFYELGGNSLMMMNLLKSIRKNLIIRKNEKFFAQEISQIILDPTFENIVAIIRKINDK
ncbi:MAG: amino acid adenylation domain-containing protein [Pseudomonadota bacterium]